VSEGKGIQFETEALNSIYSKVEELSRSLGDLRPLFEQLASDFYKDEKRIFNLRGPGQYEDLDPDYQEVKERKWGHVYPILFASGRLAASLLSRRAVNSVSNIDKLKFEIGTSVRYAVYHHSPKPRESYFGTPRLPRRPIWFFGEDNDRLSMRWDRTTQSYIDKTVAGVMR